MNGIDEMCALTALDVPPPAEMVYIVGLLIDKNISVACVNNIWHSKSNIKGTEDIFLCYVGNGKYMKTEVGKLFLLILQ